MNDKLGYTLVGTSTLLTAYGWAAAATVVVVGLTVYILYNEFGDD